jgi:hypothetical protein
VLRKKAICSKKHETNNVSRSKKHELATCTRPSRRPTGRRSLPAGCVLRKNPHNSRLGKRSYASGVAASSRTRREGGGKRASRRPPGQTPMRGARRGERSQSEPEVVSNRDETDGRFVKLSDETGVRNEVGGGRGLGKVVRPAESARTEPGPPGKRPVFGRECFKCNGLGYIAAKPTNNPNPVYI